VDPAERLGDGPEDLRGPDLREADRPALDEACDEIALGSDERDDLGPDADAGRGNRGGVLDLAADAEEVGVVAGQSDDVAVRSTVDRDEEVPVRDPAAQGDEMELRVAELGDPSKRRGELLAQLAS